MKSVWLPSDANPPSMHDLQKTQASRRTSNMNKFIEFDHTHKLDLEGDKIRANTDNILSELDGTKLHPLPSYKKKLNNMVLAVGKSEKMPFSRPLQNGFVTRQNEVKETKKRVAKLTKLRDREDSF